MNSKTKNFSFWQHIGTRKMTVALLIGVIILLFASFFNSYFIAKKYMNFLVYSESIFLQKELNDSFEKTNNLSETIARIPQTLAQYPVPRMDKRTITTFYVLEDQSPSPLYSSDNRFYEVSNPVLKQSYDAKTAQTPVTRFIKAPGKGIYISSVAVVAFQGKLFAVNDMISLYHMIGFSSFSTLLLFIAGLLILFWGISFVVSPSVKSIQKDRKQTYELLDRAGVGIRVVDIYSKKALYANAKLYEDLGDFTEKNWKEVWDLQNGSYGSGIEKLDDIKGPCQCVLYSGKLDKWFDCYLSPTTFSDGSKVIIETYVDITARTKAQEQLQVQSALTSSNLNGMIARDLAGNKIYMNNAVCEMAGYEKHELPLEQVSAEKLHSAENAEKVNRAIAQVLQTNKPVSFENEMIRKDGGLISVLQHIFPIKNERDLTIGVGVILNDITRLKKAQRLLELQEAILHAADDFVSAVDKDFNGLFANPYAYTLSGYTPEEVGLDVNPRLVYDEKTARLVTENGKKVMQTQRPWKHEHLLKRKDGKLIPVEQKLFVLKNEAGQSVGLGTIIRDLSVVKQAQRDVAETKERLEIALENSKAGVWEIDFEKNIGKYDAAAAALFDLDKDKTEMPLDKVFPILQQILVDENGKEFLHALATRTFSDENVTHLFKKIKHLDGRVNYVTTYGHPIIRNGKQAGTIGMSIDVTDRYNLEQEILEMKNRLENALKSSGGGVWEFDYRKRTMHFDDITRKIFDFRIKDRHEMSFDELIAYIRQRLDKDDARFWLHVLTKHEISQNDDSVNRELKISWIDGSFHYIEVFWTTFYDEQHKPLRTIGMSVDVTRRHNMEKELRLSKKTAEEANQAKSQFLSNMSHEIRTPMNAIIGMTKLAKDAEDIKKIRNYLSKVEVSSAHLLEIINTILDLSKIDSGKFELIEEDFDLEKLLVDLITVLSVRADEKQQNLFVKIHNNVPRNLFGDSTRFSQVLMNLLTNAIKFTPELGKVSLEIYTKSRDGNNIVLECNVSDTGIGMTPDQLKNLFQAFEQADKTITKKYGGTGLGLAISKKIVNMMGGQISVKSVYGSGSEFKFTISVKASGVEQEPVRDIMTKFGYNNFNILVVDDSPEICEYMASILKEHQITVTTANSGAEALKKVKQGIQNNQPFNIIFMDLKMEGMDGMQTTRQIKALRDDYSIVIMMSMYDMELIETEAKTLGINKFISKPIFPSTVLNTIYEIMGINRASHRISSAARPQEADFKFKSVLVVEDMEINREILANVLQNSKVKVSMAEDGEQAVDLFKKDPFAYDLILMDVQMPKKDGYAATREIRASGLPRAQEIPIIALTANAFKEDIDASTAAGMNGHLSKPVDDSKLFSLLQKYLGGNDTPTTATTGTKKTIKKIPTSADLKGFDVRGALQIMNNNTKLYLRLLNSFIENGSVPQLLAAIERKDIKAAAERAHALKGIAANLKLTDLFELVGRLDQQLSKNILPDQTGPDVTELKTVYARNEQTIKDLSLNPALLDAHKE